MAEPDELDSIVERIYQIGFAVGQYTLPPNETLEKLLAEQTSRLQALINKQRIEAYKKGYIRAAMRDLAEEGQDKIQQEYFEKLNIPITDKNGDPIV